MARSSGLLVRGLSTGYRRRPVFRDLTLPPIAAGSVTAFVGPNAAGKSTLLLALAGLLPAKGTLALGELDLLRLPAVERARVAAFMPQTLPQGVGLTVIESVIAALKASPVGGDDGSIPAARRAVATLDRLGIAELGLEPLDRLSGGQRQLASLAQAVAREPRLLLLDEPTSALDLRHQITVMSLIRSLAGEGRTVVVVLHDLNLAARWADFVVVLDRGTLAAAGPPAEALTPELLARVYGVEGRIERDTGGRPMIFIDGPLDAGHSDWTVSQVEKAG